MVVQWALLGLLILTTPIHALRTVGGSPCTSLCGTTTETTPDDIVCLDQNYTSATPGPGQAFQSCVSCLLSSGYQNTTIGETDVDWGLYNLRYAFSSCVYNYPESVTNVSTPCLVSCTSLGPALETQLTDPVGSSLFSFCSSTSFADNVVSTCESCYALTSQQAYLANFLESVRYNCHFPTSGGVAFPIAATRIFNETQLPTTTVAYTSTATSKGSSTVQKWLTMIIVMPIIGFLIIVALLSLCCFCLVRHRRKVAKRRRNQSNRWAPTAFNTPWQPAWGGSPYQQQSPMIVANPPQQYMMGGAIPFGAIVPGNGFEVVEHDGKRYEAGYSTHYISPVSPEGSAPQQPFQFGTDVTHIQQQQYQAQHMKDPIVSQQTESDSKRPQHQEYYPPPGAPHAL